MVQEYSKQRDLIWEEISNRDTEQRARDLERDLTIAVELVLDLIEGHRSRGIVGIPFNEAVTEVLKKVKTIDRATLEKELVKWQGVINKIKVVK